MDQMNNMNMGQQPAPAPAPAPAPQPQKSGSGSLWAVIVIIAVVAIALFYFWNNRADNAGTDDLRAISEQSTSDAAADIEADLNATDLDSIDYDLNEENYNAS